MIRIKLNSLYKQQVLNRQILCTKLVQLQVSGETTLPNYATQGGINVGAKCHARILTLKSRTPPSVPNATLVSSRRHRNQRKREGGSSERAVTWYGIKEGAGSPDSPYAISGHTASISRSRRSGRSTSSSPCGSCQPREAPQIRSSRATNLRDAGARMSYLGEEEGAEEAGEEEEGAGDEHHREPQPRPHQPPASAAAPDGSAALHAARARRSRVALDW
jgi:hypothetical protein